MSPDCPDAPSQPSAAYELLVDIMVSLHQLREVCVWGGGGGEFGTMLAYALACKGCLS